MLTGTELARTGPRDTIGWMSMPVVSVAVRSVDQSSRAVVRVERDDAREPSSANTRSSSTATPNGPMLKPYGSLFQSTLPSARSTA